MTLFAMLTLAVAIAPVAWLARTRLAGVREWLVASAAATAMSSAAVLVGPWALSSVYLRFVVVAALMAALVVSAFRALRTAPPADQRAGSRRLVLQACTACVFGVVSIGGFAGMFAPDQTTDLHFPLKGGGYAVLQGGNSFVTNPFHHWFPSDRYGLDLVKLNALGNRARGLSPGALSDYASYGVDVHSPCAGIVEEVVDGVPDNAPGETDADHISGNHVLLRCGPLRVLLAHLRPASVAVIAGAPVRGGQLIGRIGNSGNTNEPHLHVSAVAADAPGPWRRAAGVPMTFDGRFLSVNDVVR
jgi:murein DD-endopeptidase MepM/ murein hydrolase activator NlpD